MEINRNGIMKTLLGAFLILIIYLGIQVASLLYVYEVIIEGVLGLFFIYLFFRVFWGSETVFSKKDAFKIPKIGGFVRLVSFAFVFSILCFWALVRIADLIEYMLNLL